MSVLEKVRFSFVLLINTLYERKPYFFSHNVLIVKAPRDFEPKSFFGIS